MSFFKSQSSFTLAELLITIAILAVISTAVIMVFNPIEYIKRARDSQRLNDLTNLSKTISWYEADTQGRGFMGTSSIVYVSIPDTTSTCANLGLPPLPSGWNYNCVTSQNLQKTDGTGWIPVNLNQLSFGKTLSKLPIDPINQTSTGNYYTYVAGGSFEITAMFESEKQEYKNLSINDGDAFPGVYSIRSSSNPLTPGLRDKNLVGYWSFDEGSGTTAYDRSGNNNHGTLINGPTWQTEQNCKVGKCLSFDGVDDYVRVIDDYLPLNNQSHTILAWIKPNKICGECMIIFEYGAYSSNKVRLFFFRSNSLAGAFWSNDFTSNLIPSTTTWQLAVWRWDNVLNKESIFLNLIKSERITSGINTSDLIYGYIGGIYGNWYWQGFIDEVRIYNRALSDLEIQAIYNLTK